MGKKNSNADKQFTKTLRKLQIELVKFQKQLIASGDRVLILIEGRDAAGKDGAIKCVTEHLSPRETRVVALGKPSDRDRASWYFQRYAPHLPASQEMVLFNRSWYNRAGVERVMGFCTEGEYENFMDAVTDFEHLLVRSGIKLLKYYFDISQETQKKRLAERREDPLKQWKISPIDEQAIARWDDYSLARNSMFARTHNAICPWTIVRMDRKKTARLNMIRDFLFRMDYEGKDRELLLTNPDIVFEYDEKYLQNGMIAP